MKRWLAKGFSLLEMLMTILIMGILATAAIPVMDQDIDQKLNVAAEETANILRYAISEQQRSGDFILIDCKSNYGTLKLYRSSSTAQLNSPITDPVSKKTYEFRPVSHAFSQGVDLVADFFVGVYSYDQLLIRPGSPRFEVFNGVGVSKGALEANSRIQLRYGSKTIYVRINESTGLVTIN